MRPLCALINVSVALLAIHLYLVPASGNSGIRYGQRRSMCPIEDQKYDYAKVLKLSLLFYEAQRSGKLPPNQRVTWRRDSALDDRGMNGEDLTGGYYDAGDAVKFVFPLASAMTFLSWGAIDFGMGYSAAGQYEHLLQAVKWGTDFIIKCHTSPKELYALIGNVTADHELWRRPEDMTIERPAYKIDAVHPGSDLAGEAAAALSAAAILFQMEDPAYSEELLEHAMQLFEFAYLYKGKYSDSVPEVQEYYKSWNGYEDELAWAATWLFAATNQSFYLEKAEEFIQKVYHDLEVPSWDDKTVSTFVLLAKTTEEANYAERAGEFCKKARNETPKSPKGQAFFLEWGSLRYSANAAFICIQVAHLGLDPEENMAFAKNQIQYILGSSGRSFVVGYGPNPPKRPHHAGSSCPRNPNTECDWDHFDAKGPNPNPLLGALVGGPRAPDDNYRDNRTDYIMNEVSLDFNAGFQGALAALKEQECLEVY